MSGVWGACPIARAVQKTRALCLSVAPCALPVSGSRTMTVPSPSTLAVGAEPPVGSLRHQRASAVPPASVTLSASLPNAACPAPTGARHGDSPRHR